MNSESIIPGDSPDPDNDVESKMKVAWALGASALSAGILTYSMNKIGIPFLPVTHDILSYSRFAAFIFACINILCWAWFPLEDLRVLRKWVRTKKAFFSAQTAEFIGMVLATILLVSLAVSTTINALTFGLVGAGVYLWDILGFAMIRGQISKAIIEAKARYRKEPSEDKKALLINGIDVVERHWACSEMHTAIANHQQIRRILLLFGFLAVAMLGFLSLTTTNSKLEIFAYLLGSIVIIGAEVSHAIWRSRRDKELHQIFEELRELHSNAT